MAIFNKIQKSIFTQNLKENGSKFFQVKVPIILAGASYFLTFKNADAQYWLPFDFLAINNNSAVDFDFWINQDKDNTIYSASGTIKILEDTPINTIIINNISTSDSIADTLILGFRKKGVDSQNIIQKISKYIGV